MESISAFPRHFASYLFPWLRSKSIPSCLSRFRLLWDFGTARTTLELGPTEYPWTRSLTRHRHVCGTLFEARPSILHFVARFVCALTLVNFANSSPLLCSRLRSNVAYMQAIAGDLDDGLESLDACVDVVLRYPGIIRFRCVCGHPISACAWCSSGLGG